MAQSISIPYIGSIIFEELIDFLQQKHLLAYNMVCSSCNTSTPMTRRQRSDISDGSNFLCGSCKSTKLLRTGSSFSKSKQPPQQWLVLLYWWVREYISS